MSADVWPEPRAMGALDNEDDDDDEAETRLVERAATKEPTAHAN